MKKYIIVKTKEPVDIGDTIEKSKEISTSFGTIKSVEKILVTVSTIPELIKSGLIKKVEEVANKYDISNNIGYYVSTLAKKYQKSFEEITEWLDKTNKLCPKAVFDILLNEIAIDFYNKNHKAFEDAEEYYSIRLKDGKVGKVTNYIDYLPVFKSVEDAEKARAILKEQLEFMYGRE
jgi:hypothetical protein